MFLLVFPIASSAHLVHRAACASERCPNTAFESVRAVVQRPHQHALQSVLIDHPSFDRATPRQFRHCKYHHAIFEPGNLSPIAHEWFANWSSILNLPEISSVARLLTRTVPLDALQAVSATVQDVVVGMSSWLCTKSQRCIVDIDV
jgi:hypothetical protein